MESLRGNPAIGASWEGYVIEQIIREAPEFSGFYFYRTQHGAEADFSYVITPGGECFNRSGGLRICPLSIFLEKELPALK